MKLQPTRHPHLFLRSVDLTEKSPGEHRDRKREIHRVSDSPKPDADDRVGSWKEIASHLKRTVRTVQRWEKHERLPIHRHRHRRGNSVHAYKSELNDWWNRDARSVEDKPTLLLTKDAPPRAASSQVVKAIDSKVECQERDTTSTEWFVECALEIRLVGFRSGDRTGGPVCVLRVPIPILGHPPRTGARSTTRSAKESCRSLSLAAS